MKVFILVLLSILTFSLKSNTHLKRTIIATDTISDALVKRKEAIDKYLRQHSKEVLLYAKVPGKNTLVRVKNQKWPEEVEYSYNVLKDASGKIIYIMQSPFSESGDWDIEDRHYFDEQGNTFAFAEEQSIFNNDVKGGIVREERTNFYKADFNLSSTKYKMMDKDWKIVKRKRSEFDFRNYPFKIYKNRDDCLKGYQIVNN